MIQMCSSCGTRWNVRDKQRVWCPRCQGTLMPPTDHHPAPPDLQWRQPATSHVTPQRLSAPALPPGFRWIAVRPGGAPPARRPRRPLGPTPRYQVIPRWGLGELEIHRPAPVTTAPRGPSPHSVRRLLTATAVALGAAAIAYLVRYVLLIVNRTTLLNPIVAAVAEWSAILVGIAAFVLVAACWVMLTRWLIARRRALFAYHGVTDPRPAWALWAGCLVPLVNLAWAPVFVVDTATAEDNYRRLRKPVLVWWIFWVLSTAASVFAFATSFTDSAQGIADNHVATICAYLIALATVLAVTRVYDGFESKPVERPAHRWVVVAQDRPIAGPTDATTATESTAAVEPTGREPAA